ncbi:MAG: DUF5069 domain-containing protein [Verrucomicrobiae bacterium]|nr:DUF5069 domain-containing protein [Verrucomicrobiae bacterium]
MNDYNWPQDFRKIFDHAINLYREGKRDSSAFFDSEQLAFLSAMGCKAQELYDFAEDTVSYGEPPWETVLLIASVRREYFEHVQKGVPSGKTHSMSDFPGKTDAVDGIVWLPRIIMKARCKLRGELPHDMMYGCGGDRDFLSRHKIHPAHFLRLVWSAGDDDRKIIDWVKSRS